MSCYFFLVNVIPPLVISNVADLGLPEVNALDCAFADEGYLERWMNWHYFLLLHHLHLHLLPVMSGP